MIKYIFIKIAKQLILLVVIVNQFICTAFSQNLERTFESRSGNFPILISSLDLPEMEKVPLVRVSPQAFPRLPDWRSSRFLPEDPSWLDRGGKFFKEGMTAYYTERPLEALKHFRQVLESYPETPWFVPSLFWSGQLLVLDGKYDLALERLKTFEREASKINFPFQKDFLDRSRYTRIWIDLKQERSSEELLPMLKQTVEEVQEQGIKFKLFELQIFALQKANKIDAAKSLLRQMEELFPGQGQPTLWLAQIHYHLGDWNSLVQMLDESLQDKELFPAQYLDSLLLMGIHAAIELEQFNLADNWVRLFKELSRDRNDLPLLATIRVQQKLQDYAAIGTSWEQMNDDLLRSKVMREVFRQAEKDFQYDFPISYEFDERYWLDWKAEGQLIKAHSFRKKNQRDEAYRLYQISHALAEDSPVIRERALYHRVLIELEVKDYERSEKHLEQLLASYPESIYRSEYHFWYALVLHEKNLDPIRSLMALRQIDEGSERVDDSLFLQGRIHLEQSNWSQAVRVFRKLKTNLVDSPYLEPGLLFLAEAFFQQKNHVEAQAVLSELRQKFNPLQEPIPVIHLQVRNLKAMGAFEEADDLLRKDLQQHSDFSLIQLHLSILEELGDQQGILETSRLGLNLAATENQAYLHLQRANALYQTENYAKAFVHYEQALFSPPAGQQAFIRFRLIKIHYQQKEFGAFESRAKAFLEEDHQSENANDLLLMLGTYYFQQDRPEKAKPYLEQLVSNQVLAVRNPELDPVRRLELVTRIGEQYNLLEDFQSAEQWLNQGLRLMEDLPDQKKDYHLRILREKGLAAFNQGKYNRALSSDLKVNYLDKNLSSEQKYKLSLRIAQSYQKLKRYREAKTIYQKMLKNNKDERLQKEIKSRIKKLEEIDS